MNRRAFLISGFILGLNIALGNKLKAVEAEEPLYLPVRGGFTFDGTQPMKCGPFKLNEPMTVYFVGEQVTWDSGRLFDGRPYPIVMRPAPSC